MAIYKQQQVTIIYHCELTHVLKQQVCTFMKNTRSRVIIPQSFKRDKDILAVIAGEVEVLNLLGERAMPTKEFSIAS